MAEVAFAKGLEGVVAAESSICKIDGEHGKLYYRGYSIQDLAAHSDFEETTFLLLYERLPTKGELEAFRKRMRESRRLATPILDMIRNFPVGAHPMELLQSVISYLSGYVEHKIHHSATCNCRDTLHQIVQLASVVAAYNRYRNGEDYVPPRMDLSHGGNFLYMMRGTEPEPYESRIMDVCLILHAEHGFNASTFTARVVASTMSTCYSSISAAIGALYGTLHGGANEDVMNMIEKIGSKANVEKFVNDTLDRHEKIPGMGHRVYKAKDPRAIVIEELLDELSEKSGDRKNQEILKDVERVFRARMETAGKPIYPNVDFFSGAVYTMLGFPKQLFTPVFAVSRVSGWLAHVLEQRVGNRIYRPTSRYVGPEAAEYIPIDSRR
ncbi:MAG TPA: citrate/2-methylcitrate synthase [Spirochaetia bacterium]|nr:citrate/2-methylcitrate synthase [Spirochaetia bacterium]